MDYVHIQWLYIFVEIVYQVQINWFDLDATWKMETM